jgi:hypothetical protein
MVSSQVSLPVHELKIIITEGKGFVSNDLMAFIIFTHPSVALITDTKGSVEGRLSLSPSLKAMAKKDRVIDEC